MRNSSGNKKLKLPALRIAVSFIAEEFIRRKKKLLGRNGKCMGGKRAGKTRHKQRPGFGGGRFG